MVLVGPSGSGKSTALRMVAGLEDATAGDDPHRRRAWSTTSRPRTATSRWSSRATRSIRTWTWRDNLGFALKMQRMRARVDRRARAARPPGAWASASCSSAARGTSRAASASASPLGRAIVREPQAFLMDEPLSNLDAKLRVEMRAYIARLHQELGTTTLYVTHDQTEAMTMGDRVAVMRDGRLEQVDAPQALYDQPGRPVRGGLHRLAGDEPARAVASSARDGASTWSSAPSACTLPGRAPRCGARRAADAPVVVGSGPRRCPTRPRPRRRPGARGCASSSSSRWAPTCWSMRAVDAPAVLTEDQLEARARGWRRPGSPTSCALASPRACAPGVPVARGRRPAPARRPGAPALLRPRHDARHPVSGSASCDA